MQRIEGLQFTAPLFSGSSSQAANPPAPEDRPHREADHHAVYEPSLDQCEHGLGLE